MPAPLFVTSSGTRTVPAFVAEFAPGASGDVAPVRTVGGPDRSRLVTASGVAVDQDGSLYVAAPVVRAVNAYAPGAHGDVAPFAILTGRNAGLTNPQGLVVRDGLLYVANGPFGPGAPGVPSVTVFTLPLVPAAGAPIAVIAGPATGLDSPFGLALDASGNIYVANLNNTVTVYAPPPPSSHATPHDVAPILTIAAGLNGPEGVAISGNVLYVATDDNTIARFSLPTGAPGAVIAGPDTRLHQPLGIDVDSSGRIFVVNTGDEVLTFAPDAAGNVAPIAVLAGPATGFNGVQFVAVGLGDASS